MRRIFLPPTNPSLKTRVRSLFPRRLSLRGRLPPPRRTRPLPQPLGWLRPDQERVADYLTRIARIVPYALDLILDFGGIAVIPFLSRAPVATDLAKLLRKAAAKAPQPGSAAAKSGAPTKEAVSAALPTRVPVARQVGGDGDGDRGP